MFCKAIPMLWLCFMVNKDSYLFIYLTRLGLSTYLCTWRHLRNSHGNMYNRMSPWCWYNSRHCDNCPYLLYIPLCLKYNYTLHCQLLHIRTHYSHFVGWKPKTQYFSKVNLVNRVFVLQYSGHQLEGGWENKQVIKS